MLLVLVSVPFQGHAESEAVSDEGGPSYRSMMEGSTPIKKAVFQKQVFLQGIPESAKIQTFELSLDGTNYVLSVLPGGGGSPIITAGQFRGAAWEVTGPNLVLSNPLHNTNTTPTSALEITTRLTVDTFLNLGIPEVVRASLTWDEAHNRIYGRAADGSEILIELEQANGLPIKATIRLTRHGGEAVAYVRCRYDSNFFHGKAPVAFTRYAAGAPSEEVGRLYTVTLKKLEYSKAPLPLEGLNPEHLFRELAAKSTIFYSNNAPYWIGQGSKRPQKVLSAEEYNKSMQRLTGRSPAVGLTRKRVVIGMLFVTLLIPIAVYLLFSITKTGTKENKC